MLGDYYEKIEKLQFSLGVRQGYFFLLTKQELNYNPLLKIVIPQTQGYSFSGMVKRENDLYGIYRCVLYNPVGNPVEGVFNIAATIVDKTSGHPDCPRNKHKASAIQRRYPN